MVHTTLITGPERRRRWSEDQKLTVLSAAFAPGARVAEVARRADVLHEPDLPLAQGFSDGGAGVRGGGIDGRTRGRRGAAVSAPAIVVDMADGERVTIHPGADSATIAATLRALR